MINLTVTWRDRWHWWHGKYPSRYAKGELTGGFMFGFGSIYRHKQSGQIRLYSDANMDGQRVSINGGPPVTLRPRGRFGKLYLGFEED